MLMLKLMLMLELVLNVNTWFASFVGTISVHIVGDHVIHGLE